MWELRELRGPCNASGLHCVPELLATPVAVQRWRATLRPLGSRRVSARSRWPQPWARSATALRPAWRLVPPLHSSRSSSSSKGNSRAGASLRGGQPLQPPRAGSTSARSPGHGRGTPLPPPASQLQWRQRPKMRPGRRPWQLPQRAPSWQLPRTAAAAAPRPLRPPKRPLQRLWRPGHLRTQPGASSSSRGAAAGGGGSAAHGCGAGCQHPSRASTHPSSE